MTTERFSELLHDTVPEPPHHIDPDTVLRKANRHRATRTAGIALVAVAGLVATGFGLSPLLGTDSGDENQVVKPPPEIAEHNGVQFTLPKGWKIVDPLPNTCKISADRTVQVGVTFDDAECPDIEDPLQRVIRMTDLYGGRHDTPEGFDGIYGWPKQPGMRPDHVENGQPAWLQSATVPASDGINGGYASLTLPWTNTVVFAYGPTRAAAEDLLDRVEVPELPDTLSVPPDAKAIDTQAYIDGGMYGPTIEDPAKIREVLDALRELEPEAELTDACADPAEWKPAGVELRIVDKSGDDHPYFIRNDRCGVTTGPQGGAFQTSPELWNLLMEFFESAN